MWTYVQNSGTLIDPEGRAQGGLYSGHGPGVNNPAMQDIADVGPIPTGVWRMGEAGDNNKTGPLSIPLEAEAETQSFGRSGFLIHGDEIEHPGERLASHGCIIAPRSVREALAASPDRRLEVIADLSL